MYVYLIIRPSRLPRATRPCAAAPTDPRAPGPFAVAVAHMRAYTYIYIYIYKRERERVIHIYIYIYTHIYTYRERERTFTGAHMRARSLLTTRTHGADLLHSVPHSRACWVGEVRLGSVSRFAGCFSWVAWLIGWLVVDAAAQEVSAEQQGARRWP